MKRICTVTVIAFVSFLLFVAGTFAQPGQQRGFKWSGSGGWGTGSQYQRMYNPQTVETVTGAIESLETMVPAKGMRNGIHIKVKTDKETISVHLGPAWYIERLDVKLEKGDNVQVKGSRINFFNKPAIIAAEVKKGGDLLVLRDNAGFPAWAGWRR